MTDSDTSPLDRGLDQLAALLDAVGDDDLARPTPCHDWTVAELVDHVVAAPRTFARQVRGEEVDWAAPTPHVGEDRAEAFRAAADELRTAWAAADGGPGGPGLDLQCAEVAVHGYDLAASIGQPTDTLDTELAERALTFLRANLTADNRGPAFGPEQPAPEGADAYQRLAAFAGRGISARA